MPLRNRTIVNCTACDAELERTPCQLRRNKNHFCDPGCNAKWMSRTMTEKNQNKHISVPCSECGAQLIRLRTDAERVKHNFCDKSCGVEWRKKLRGNKSYTWKGGKVKVHCTICGNELWRGKWQLNASGNNFCNRECQGVWNSLYRTGQNNPCFKGGGQIYYGPNWETQKRAARQRDNYLCQTCGIGQNNLKRLLHVHHIKPFRVFNYIRGINENYKEANRLENLICLCGKCHMQVEAGKISFQPRLL